VVLQVQGELKSLYKIKDEKNKNTDVSSELGKTAIRKTRLKFVLCAVIIHLNGWRKNIDKGCARMA
jgi:hypothetical protein